MTGTTPRAPGEAPPWAIRLVQDIVDWAEAKLRGPQALTIYHKAMLPDAARHRSALIAVDDEAGGFTPAYSDGTSWRRTADGNVVS